jgi:nitrogen fixation NifU-like protein
MENPSVQLGGGNPGCGDLITVYLRISDDDRIEEVSFEGDGCTISQAGGSMIAEIIEGMTLDEVQALGTHTMIEEMGEETVKSRVRCASEGLPQRTARQGGYPGIVRELEKSALSYDAPPGNIARWGVLACNEACRHFVTLLTLAYWPLN